MNSGRHNVLLLIVLLAAQLLVASGSSRRSPRAGTAETIFMKVTSPAVSLSRGVSYGIRGVGRELRSMFTARARAEALQAQVEWMAEELVRGREFAGENRRLRRLLGMQESLGYRSVGASIVTSHFDRQTRMLIVDRGTADGVRVDFPVVAWGGAVGRVILAGRHRSKVRVLNDANSGVAGVVQRSRAQGMVLGRPRGELNMLYVPRFSDVVHGDRVVTSGLDGIFPRGFGLGRVSAIAERPDGTQTIRIAPELDYASLEEVLVLLDAPILDEPEAAEDGE